VDPSFILFLFSLTLLLFHFPTMNPRELVDHIRSGPAELVLDKPLRFRRRTRSNPCDFSEFLRALQSNETIRTAECGTHQTLGITEHEWVLLVKTLGSIKGIENLTLYCRHGSRNFHPFQAVADAVKNAQSLRKLEIVLGSASETFPRDPSGITALANALREHTALQEFLFYDWCPLLGTAQSSTALHPLLRALPACPHLRKVGIMTKCASADAMKNLLKLRPATELHLVLEKDYWLAVADEIRQGRCNVQMLTLVMFEVTKSEATEVVKAVASAIRCDHHLKQLHLHMENGFTDEAGEALAEALKVNKTLRVVSLDATDVVPDNNVRTKATLGAQSYEAFCAMLRVNTGLCLELFPFEACDAGTRLLECRGQLHIEQRLNEVGRGRLLLSSRQTTKEEWVCALHDLNFWEDLRDGDNFSAFRVSCVYSLLRSNPSVVRSTLFSVPHLQSKSV
jgi:hypothetical protein